MKTKYACLMSCVILGMGLVGVWMVTFSVFAAPSERIPIRWFIGLGGGNQPDQVAAQQQVVDDFNASQTEISLTLEVVDNAVAVQVLQDEINAGNPPDIVGPVGIYGANYFQDQWLDMESLVLSTGYDLTDFDPTLINLFQINEDGLTGLPITIYPSFIFYNKDLFDSAGLAYPPHLYNQPYTDTVHGGAWTIEKLEEIAKLLTLDNMGANAIDPLFDYNQIVQFGFTQQWSDARGQATLFGADSFLDQNGNAQIPENWRVAFNWVYAGMWSEYFIPNAPYANSEWFGAGNPFNSGHLAMAHTHSWYLCCLNNIPHWDIAATPAYSGSVTSKLHADSFRILSSTAHTEEAFQVLAYLTDYAASNLVDVYNGFPARISLQTTAINDLEVEYPDVDWQVLLDSIDFADDPNSESYLPNYQKAQNRILAFKNLLENNPGINVNNALDSLRNDLQIIFNEHLLYLPVVVR